MRLASLWTCLLLLAGGVRAETYSLLDGSLTLDASGARETLAGHIEAAPFGPDPFPDPDLLPLLVDDFSLRAGGFAFEPDGPIVHDGMGPIGILQIADQITVNRDDDVLLFYLRSGGDVVAASDSLVLVRYLDLRAGLEDGGRVFGRLDDGVSPRRIEVSGRLLEVGQAFRIRGPCPPPPPIVLPPRPGPPPGGGVIISIPPNITEVPDLEFPGRRPDRGPLPDDPILSSFFCGGLVPVPSRATVVGAFELIATAAIPMDVDVVPWRRHPRVVPGRRRSIPVAILGSDTLDVRDLDPASLRLGPGAAAARGGRRGPWTWVGDVNRDSHRDLVARFSVRESEIAFGDGHVCLLAESFAGDVHEGCDAIDTGPGRRSPRWRLRR